MLSCAFGAQTKKFLVNFLIRLRAFFSFHFLKCSPCNRHTDAKRQCITHCLTHLYARKSEPLGQQNYEWNENKPLRAAATRLARKGLRIVCISMFVRPMVGSKINVTICHRSATAPIATTSGSLRKSVITSLGKHSPNTAHTAKKIVPMRMQ